MRRGYSITRLPHEVFRGRLSTCRFIQTPRRDSDCERCTNCCRSRLGENAPTTAVRRRAAVATTASRAAGMAASCSRCDGAHRELTTSPGLDVYVVSSTGAFAIAAAVAKSSTALASAATAATTATDTATDTARVTAAATTPAAFAAAAFATASAPASTAATEDFVALASATCCAGRDIRRWRVGRASNSIAAVCGHACPLQQPRSCSTQRG